ncbi:MAG: LysM domain-containing protein [Burkholderiaceae bacterium]
MKTLLKQVIALGLALVASTAPAQKATAPLKVKADAPDRYVVVKGDTLWGIAGRFLDKPWRWPEIWQLNRDSINDPHWIYPGNIVYLDTSGASPRLRLGKAVGGGTTAGSVRVKPMVRSEPLAEDAIPMLSLGAISAFLNRPLVVDEKQLASNPRIVATQEGRVYLGRGDRAYVRGIKAGDPSEWHIYRRAKPLLDPDTRKPIAYEALFVGSAKLVREGDPATVDIVSVAEEVGVGDRLMPATRGKILNFAPRPPEAKVSGRIVSVYRGVTQVGRNSVVAINRGEADGLKVGNVLAIKLLGRTIVDRENKNERVKLPDESVGHLMIFRVFDKIAYGLVMEASQSISVGDTVTSP